MATAQKTFTVDEVLQQLQSIRSDESGDNDDESSSEEKDIEESGDSGSSSGDEIVQPLSVRIGLSNARITRGLGGWSCLVIREKRVHQHAPKDETD